MMEGIIPPQDWEERQQKRLEAEQAVSGARAQLEQLLGYFKRQLPAEKLDVISPPGGKNRDWERLRRAQHLWYTMFCATFDPDRLRENFDGYGADSLALGLLFRYAYGMGILEGRRQARKGQD